MYTFGRKCPRCKGRNLSPLALQPWMDSFPAARHYLCRTCSRDILSFFPISVLLEKRTSKRFKMPSNLLVRLKGQQEQFARIHDLSENGLRFSYNYDSQKLADTCLEVDLYNCELGTFLEGLPIRILSNTFETRQIGGRPTTIVWRGACFGPLNRAQKTILKNYITTYGQKEQSSLDS
ncbi:PilZ domain-containing protein [Desulfolithobacter sp.]